MVQTPGDSRSAAALARNERYVREFVEAFRLCPYAKRCRETGKLHRAVLLDEGGVPGTPGFDTAVTALADAIARFELLSPDSIDVGLILLPALVPALARGLDGAHAFERLVSAARERTEARHGGGDTPFYCVPFHPGFAEDLRNEHRAVRFIRRSPDPTVQLVRASVLRVVRDTVPGRPHFIDVSKLNAAELLAITVPFSVSDRIARANLHTLHREGHDRPRELLRDIRAHARQPDE